MPRLVVERVRTKNLFKYPSANSSANYNSVADLVIFFSSSNGDPDKEAEIKKYLLETCGKKENTEISETENGPSSAV